jgi:hypothetical protein
MIHVIIDGIQFAAILYLGRAATSHHRTISGILRVEQMMSDQQKEFIKWRSGQKG